MAKRDETLGAGRAAGGGSIPFGGLLLVATIAAIFAYGIVLKAAGPSVDETIQTMTREGAAPPLRSSPAATRGSGSASPSAGAHADRGDASLSDLFGDTAADPSGASHEKPLIPESRSAALSLSSPSPSPASPTPQSSVRPAVASPPPPPPRVAGTGRTSTHEPGGPPSAPASTERKPGSVRAGASPVPSVHLWGDGSRKGPAGPAPATPRPAPAGGTLALSGTKAKDSSLAGIPSPAGSSTPERASGRPPADPSAETTPSTGGAPVLTAKMAALESSAPSQSPHPSPQGPRGDAPAAAVRRAKTSLAARDYRSAARAWNDWAWSAPPGSWTVQIAAVRLDRAKAGSSLSSLSSRDGAFVLPSGALGGDLSPVCVGVYPSEDAARRAAAAMATTLGPSSRPIAKPLGSLRAAR